MTSSHTIVVLIVLALASSLSLPSRVESTTTQARQLEKLGRGVVAVQFEQGKVFVGWRLLGNDPAKLAFNLYRTTANAKPVKVNSQPITEATSFIDEHADLSKSNSYYLRPVLNGREQQPSAEFTLAPNSPVHQRGLLSGRGNDRTA